MHPTFRRGDVLFVEPALPGDLRPGDVVVFGSAQRNARTPVVAHRVLARAPAGLITRGDAAAVPDGGPVLPEHLVGRVLWVERDGRARRVWGGNVGRLWAAWLRLRRRISPVLLWPYRLLRASGIARRLWQPPITQVRLDGEGGRLVKYVHRRRTVACWWPDEGEFWCRRPYDLVLDPPARALSGGAERSEAPQSKGAG